MTFAGVAIFVFGFTVGVIVSSVAMIGYLRRQLRRWTHPAERVRWHYRPGEGE